MRQALFGLRGASREPSSPPAGEEPPLVPTGAILRRREAMENPPNDEPMPTPKTMIWTETEACRRQVRISFWLLRLYM